MTPELIYLDHQATTPVDPRVLEIMLPYFTDVFGNAASDHEFGHQAKLAVERAREQVAEAINAEPSEIIFTSGATESDNLALFGVAERYSYRGEHIITCVTEHKAILDSCRQLEKQGITVTYLPVDQYGRVDPDDIRRVITPRTILISIMAANNEIGTIAPIKEIGTVAEEYGILFHSDAVQAVGHLPIDVEAMHVHLMSISAHKIYGPKGVGALYRRKSNPRVLLGPMIFGGGHERGLRSGTLNVPCIVGFGEAIRLASQERLVDDERFLRWSQHMFQRLSDELGGIELNGTSTERLPHNLNISIHGVESRALVVRLKDVAIATGSACSSTDVRPSHVIQALGFGEDRVHSAIRISVGRFNSDDQINAAVDRIVMAARILRDLSASVYM